MKKLLFVFILALSIVLASCACDVESVDLKNPEVQAYKLYGSDNYNYHSLYVYKYETPDAYIYRYVFGDETKNIEVVPKNKETEQTTQDTESILSKSTYFDY